MIKHSFNYWALALVMLWMGPYLSFANQGGAAPNALPSSSSPAGKVDDVLDGTSRFRQRQLANETAQELQEKLEKESRTKAGKKLATKAAKIAGEEALEITGKGLLRTALGGLAKTILGPLSLAVGLLPVKGDNTKEAKSTSQVRRREIADNRVRNQLLYVLPIYWGAMKYGGAQATNPAFGPEYEFVRFGRNQCSTTPFLNKVFDPNYIGGRCDWCRDRDELETQVIELWRGLAQGRYEHILHISEAHPTWIQERMGVIHGKRRLRIEEWRQWLLANSQWATDLVRYRPKDEQRVSSYDLERLSRQMIGDFHDMKKLMVGDGSNELSWGKPHMIYPEGHPIGVDGLVGKAQLPDAERIETMPFKPYDRFNIRNGSEEDPPGDTTEPSNSKEQDAPSKEDELVDPWAYVGPRYPNEEQQLQEILQIHGGTRPLSRSWQGTKIYYLPHAQSKPDFPGIGVDDKVVVIAFGGSGTKKASGAVFAREMRLLKRYGIAMISFDYPFHAQGPRTELHRRYGYFMEWIRALVQMYTKAELPIYLLGHSYGPVVVQELLHTTKIDEVDGVTLLSPGYSISPEARAYNQEMRRKGLFDLGFADSSLEIDVLADQWADGMAKKFTSNRGNSINTNVPVLGIAGEGDHYSTREILEKWISRYPRSSLLMVPDAGHNIFAVGRGRDRLVIRELVEFIREQGVDISEQEVSVESGYIEEILLLYGSSAAFRDWFSARGKPLEVYLINQWAAEDLLDQWTVWLAEEIVQRTDQGLVHEAVDRWLGITGPLNFAPGLGPIVRSHLPTLSSRDVDLLLEILKKKPEELTRSDVNFLLRIRRIYVSTN